MSAVTRRKITTPQRNTILRRPDASSSRRIKEHFLLPSLSIVIPTLNEAANIVPLLRRVDDAMRSHGILYEALIVDDHSTDDTIALAEEISATLDAPVRIFTKQGKPGKTYSLIEGLDQARYEALAILDGDLQYPPESLPDLLAELRHSDVVVGDRRASYTTADVARGQSSRLFNVVVGRGLLALDTDVQSGMKVFRREVYETALLRPGPWSFDLELLATAHENGFRIASSPIQMGQRQGGHSKVRVARVACELGLRALAVRWHMATHTAEEDAAEVAARTADAKRADSPSRDQQREQISRYERWLSQETTENGLRHTQRAVDAYVAEASKVVTKQTGSKQQQFRPFAPHQPAYSALTTFTSAQVIVMSALALLWLAALLAFGLATVTITLGAVTALYLFDLAVTMFISLRTLQRHPVTAIADQVVRGIRNDFWPSYTILCPLYHEAEVASQFVNAMRLLDYPTDRLQVLFLTEEDDRETRAALLAMGLPRHFTVVTVPDGGPRTKPRACNYGLMQATGDFVVIFDAEDIPDPLQLKKAVLTFANHEADLACVQASLNFYNPAQNLLTRWFTSEYSLWFGLTLPALQRMKSFLPLGGTSNHFRTRALREVGGWDPFNVTEDCDLGVRLSQFHYRTAMVDSTTYEEANPNLRNWLRQRSRWVKGYMQTYLVYMRNPMRYLREGRLSELFWLQVIVGGRAFTQLLNPILWLMLLVYVVFHAWVTPIYHVLYPAPIFYAATFCLVFGNFFYVYSYLIGCLNRRQYLLTLWSLAIPLYWALMSVASYIALYQLITKPFYWEKTQHGLHLGHQATPAPVTPAAFTPSGARAQRVVAEWGATFARSRGFAAGVGARLALTGRWLATPALSIPPLRNAVDYLAHELMVTRREYSRRDQQQATLSPSIALPIAPVVDMFSTVSLPAILRTTATRERIVDFRGTRYLVALRPLEASAPAQPRRQRAPLRWLRDRWLMATLLTSLMTSISACAYFFFHGETMLYSDADSHMRLARMTFDAATPGLAQLGDVWLPLPHILMWPFVWNDYLWTTGLAGAFVGMLCYVITGLAIFKIARLLSGNDAASYVGTLAYLLNPNILYLQSTPLSEMALLATMSLALYAFLIWTRTGQVRHLLIAAFCTFLATLTRYEGWSLFIALLALIIVVEAFRRRNIQLILGEVLLFATPGGFGIGLWLLWCFLLSGNPFFFQNGPYSAANQQAAFIARGQLPTLHNVPMDIITYGADVLEFAGPLLVLLAIAGLVIYLVGMLRRPEKIAALALVVPLALYIVSLYSGQIVLYVPGVSEHVGLNDLFNVRYGATAVIPLAVFISTLVGHRRMAQWIAIGLIVLQTSLTTMGGVITVQDGQYGLSCRSFSTTDLYLAEHYNGGRILLDMYANGGAASGLQMLGIHMSNAINIGSYQVWQAALANPANYVDWVLVTPNDAVAKGINLNASAFTSKFMLVEQDAHGDEIFYKRGLAPLPTRPAPTQLMKTYAQCGTLPATATATASSVSQRPQAETRTPRRGATFAAPPIA